MAIWPHDPGSLGRRDSYKLLVTPNREFEWQFGGKTVLAGLRLKKLSTQAMLRVAKLLCINCVLFITSTALLWHVLPKLVPWDSCCSVTYSKIQAAFWEAPSIHGHGSTFSGGTQNFWEGVGKNRRHYFFNAQFFSKQKLCIKIRGCGCPEI
jgi:hypothetical protein